MQTSQIYGNGHVRLKSVTISPTPDPPITALDVEMLCQEIKIAYEEDSYNAIDINGKIVKKINGYRCALSINIFIDSDTDINNMELIYNYYNSVVALLKYSKFIVYPNYDGSDKSLTFYFNDMILTNPINIENLKKFKNSKQIIKLEFQSENLLNQIKFITY